MARIEEAPFTRKEIILLIRWILAAIFMYIAVFLLSWLAVYFCQQGILHIGEGTASIGHYFSLLGPILLLIWVYYYIVPYSKVTWRFLWARKKQVIHTKVLAIEEVSRGIFAYREIRTDADIRLTVYRTIIFVKDIPLYKLKEGMYVEIHRVAGENNHLLRISPAEAPLEAQ